MRFTISTKGFNDIIDITSRVEEAVRKSKVRDGKEIKVGDTLVILT